MTNFAFILTKKSFCDKYSTANSFRVTMMKNNKFIKMLSFIALCAFLPQLLCIPSGASAFDYGGLTAAKYVKTESRRTYIDAAMRQYIEDSAKLQSVLKSGKAAVFLFEGGSDNTVAEPDYAKTRRDHAVILTVKTLTARLRSYTATAAAPLCPTIFSVTVTERRLPSKTANSIRPDPRLCSTAFTD